MDDLIRPVLDRVLAIDPGEIIGAYLYGSSTTTGLGPESDVDLLFVTRRSLTPEERISLVSTLLGFSGWTGHAEAFPDVANRRPLEVTSLVADDLEPLVAAPCRDFQFGEWLRKDLARGSVPAPERDPDVVILLATALASHRVLRGPSLESLVSDVPFELLKNAQLAALPALVANLGGDHRNVLLTLARALHTVETGAIVPKDQAAVTASKRVDADGAELLQAAAREYRGEEQVDWDSKSSRALTLAQSLISMIRRTSSEP
ncbi:DUF4111 domain-containing protein [Cellulosimicrobium funkei]|nr:DUF4111 domain-containing protein [Cellulosimicrobium funkei]